MQKEIADTVMASFDTWHWKDTFYWGGLGLFVLCLVAWAARRRK